MYFASLLLLGTLGVSAHPSGHAHLHRHAHAIKERAPEAVVVTATIYGKVVSWTQDVGGDSGSPFVKGHRATTSSTPTPTPTPTTLSTSVAVATSSVAAASPESSSSAASASPSSSSSSGSGSGVTTYTTFEAACKNSKRATAAEIAYTGNTGTQDGAYGCNFLLVASSDVASKYDNTVRFYGASSDQTCLMWNKIGSDGGIDGFWGVDALEFTLKAGESQYVAVDSNSQGGAACFSGSVSKTSVGEIAGAWLEFDFQNESNGGYSGADASVIVAQTAGLSFPGISVCSSGSTTDCSTITSSGVANNAYLASDVNADGIGLQADGPLKLDVNVGFN